MTVHSLEVVVEILEEKPYGFEFTCSVCGSWLRAVAEDVKVGYFGANYGGDTPDREYYVSCIVCGTDKILPYSAVTPKVQELADQTDPRNR